jgi:DNA invertase Pin-like site-specific DNA recombinase
MDRPGWNRLEADMIAGKVAKIVVWRLDRLGRTAAGLTALFEELQHRNIGFEALSATENYSSWHVASKRSPLLAPPRAQED